MWAAPQIAKLWRKPIFIGKYQRDCYDIVVDLLKARTSKAQRVKITRTQFKQHMDKIGQRPYDDDILAAAASSVNQSLSFDERLADIVRDKRWNETEPDW